MMTQNTIADGQTRFALRLTLVRKVGVRLEACARSSLLLAGGHGLSGASLRNAGSCPWDTPGLTPRHIIGLKRPSASSRMTAPLGGAFDTHTL